MSYADDTTDLRTQALFEAVEAGHTERVVALLSDGVPIDSRTAHTRTTPLIVAVRARNVQLARILIDRGASLSAQDSYGFTAVTHALLASRDYGPVFKNPDPDPRPLELLRDAGGTFGLVDAVLRNDVGLARRLLIEGADPNTGAFTYRLSGNVCL